MKIIGILLARITADEKDLKLVKIDGINTIEFIIQSLKNTPQINKIVIAAPEDRFSGYLRQLAHHYGCKVYIGDNDNITRRVQNALLNYTEGLAGTHKWRDAFL